MMMPTIAAAALALTLAAAAATIAAGTDQGPVVKTDDGDHAARLSGAEETGGAEHKRPNKPSLGFNHCSIECCGPDMPSAAFLKDTADAMVKRGLKAAGYKYVNMVSEHGPSIHCLCLRFHCSFCSALHSRPLPSG